ncbi:MAG: DUF814 domain-containing protein [Planctomycetes bacterium]|nr:DUF814 domain-containing protein [Planctomycetota bacterium]
MPKALALLSGGLDSRLAIRVIREQGIEVIALNFLTAFCRCTTSKSCKLEALAAAEALGVPIKVVNSTESMVEIVKRPKHGYGKNMNPCIDCRINLFREAKRYMAELGASFIITGEVLGQRPMSQRMDAMRLIDKEAGVTGLVLRPLCAKHMEPTIPEKDGIVDREKLLAIRGRSRKPQMQLADLFKLKDYPCPAGGCLLTDPQFGFRMKDLLAHGDATLNEVHLLKIGRHLRLDPKTKVVVGRDEADNEKLETFAKEGDVLLMLRDIPGPLTLIRGEVTDEKVTLAARLTARYSKAQSAPSAAVLCWPAGNKAAQRSLDVAPLEPAQADALLLVKPEKPRKRGRRPLLQAE